MSFLFSAFALAGCCICVYLIYRFAFRYCIIYIFLALLTLLSYLHVVEHCIGLLLLLLNVSLFW